MVSFEGKEVWDDPVIALLRICISLAGDFDLFTIEIFDSRK